MRAELYPSDVHILFPCDGTVLKKRFLFRMPHLTQGTTKRTPNGDKEDGDDIQGEGEGMEYG